MLSPERVGLPMHLLKQDSEVFSNSPETVLHLSNTSIDHSPMPLKVTPVISQETSKKLLRNISDFNNVQISVYEASPSNINPDQRVGEGLPICQIEPNIQGKRLHQKLNEFDFDDKHLDPENEEDLEILIGLIEKKYKKKKEVDYLIKYFQEIPFFQEILKTLSEQSFRTLVNKMTYQYRPKETPIFRKGDQTDKFYILLRGKVAILGNKDGGVSRTETPVTVNNEGYDLKQRISSGLTSNASSFARRKSIRPPNLEIKPTKPKKSQFRKKGSSATKQESPASRLSSGASPKEKSASRLNNSKLSISTKNIPGTPAVLKRKGSGQPHQITKQNTLKGLFSNLEKSDTGTRRASLFGASKNFTPHSPHLISFSHHMDLLKKDDGNDTILGDSSGDESDLNTSFEKYLEVTFPTDSVAKELTNGSAFGEFASSVKNKRTTTTVTMEDSHFAIVDKDVYNSTIKEFYEKVFTEKIHFLQAQHMFHDWRHNKLSSLLTLLDLKHYKKNQVIYNIDDPAKYIYFIKSGEVELLEMITCQNKRTVKNEIDELKTEGLEDLFKKARSHRDSVQLKKVISTITAGSVFGEDELLNEIDRRYIAKVSTLQAEVYQIEEKKFFSAIKETPALTRLIDLYESKLQWREDFNKNLVQSMSQQISKCNEGPKPNSKSLKPDLKKINTRVVVSATSSPVRSQARKATKTMTATPKIQSHRILSPSTSMSNLLQSLVNPAKNEKQEDSLAISKVFEPHMKRESVNLIKKEESNPKTKKNINSNSALDIFDIDRATAKTFTKIIRSPNSNRRKSTKRLLSASTTSLTKNLSDVKEMIEMQKLFPKECKIYSPQAQARALNNKSIKDPASLNTSQVGNQSETKISRTLSTKALSKIIQEKITDLDRAFGSPKAIASLPITPPATSARRPRYFLSEIFTPTPVRSPVQTPHHGLQGEKSDFFVSKEELNSLENILKLPKTLLSQFSFHIFGDTHSIMCSSKNSEPYKKEFVNIHVQKKLNEEKGGVRPPTGGRTFSRASMSRVQSARSSLQNL